MKSWLTSRQWATALALVVLIAAAIAGLVLTGNVDPQSAGRGRRRAPLVNEGLLQTARDLAPLASSRREQRYAQQAIRLADHEVDLAFADALRDASENAPPLTPADRALRERVSKADARVKADQQRLEQLKRQAAAANVLSPGLQSQLDLAQSQLELDQDELEDAKAALQRSGADPLSRVRRQFARHQATQDSANNQPDTPLALAPPPPDDNLLAQLRAWYGLHQRLTKLQQARAAVMAASAALDQQHGQLEQRLRAEVPAASQSAASATGNAVATPGSPELQAANAAQKAAVERRARDQKALSSLDKRIQDTQQLADVYSDWIAFVQLQRAQALHGVLWCVLWILLIALALLITLRAFDRILPRVVPEGARLHTARSVLRVSVQILAVLVAVFVIFGAPSQISTILGLAGAGLTVALKDFIIAFFGWFVLVGRNGIHVGDWIEINGVVGEVVELSLLRTVLLESGNWTEDNHPTGRKVAFMNGYAIEGHFFNFSTAGQWLWDELQVTVPSSENLGAVIDEIQNLVARETAENSRMAAEEWQRSSGRYRGVRPFSTAPAVQVRPAGSGVEVRVRYITRAPERHEMRIRLYRALFDLLRQEQNTAVASARR